MSRKTTNSQIAQRYAQAFFDLVPTADRASLAEEFQQVITILKDEEVNRVFTNPQTPIAQKKQLIRLMNLSKLLEQFLLLVLEKNRDVYLNTIERAFSQLVLESQQITVAEVTSAIALDKETVKRLQTQLEQYSGKTVLLNSRIDPQIGGGLIIKIDGKVIDGSVMHSLDKFKRSLIS